MSWYFGFDILGLIATHHKNIQSQLAQKFQIFNSILNLLYLILFLYHPPAL